MNIEWIVLADAAQVVGGKLYLIGGGWEMLNLSSGLGSEHRMAIAASYRVPWLETNQDQTIDMDIVHEDGGDPIFELKGQFQVGRPPGIPAGKDQRFQFAAEVVIKIEKFGGYTLTARIEGQPDTRTSFTVVPGMMIGMSG